ncbi:MAG: hypothetical protein U0326_13400 [Polyangiales bacterium]
MKHAWGTISCVCAAIGALGFSASLAACGSPTPAASGDGAVGVDATSDATSPTDRPAASCVGAACPQVRQLSAGYDYTLALIVDGTVRCWGKNDEGQCGDGSTSVRNRPVSVMNLTGVAQVAAGASHACARKTDGTVWCWGSGAFGRLGNGSTDNALTPVQVQGVSGATDLAVGYGHACAVVADATVRCWGRGTELGTGSISSSNTAVAVAGLTGVVQVAASAPATFGGSVGPFTCARKTDGTVWCWGSNDSGQLATGTTDNMPSARMAIASLVTGAQQLVAGGAHACVVQAGGAVRCWGNNLGYQLGDGTQESRATPVAPTGLTGVRAMALGRDTSCAILNDGTARCWGADSAGQLGRGMLAPLGMRYDARSAPVVTLTNIVTLALGEDHGCATTMDGVTRCWGSNSFAQLGNGTDGSFDGTPTPAAVAW